MGRLAASAHGHAPTGTSVSTGNAQRALAPGCQRHHRGRSMIPRAAITAWRAFAPWLTDAQVEQDLVLSRAIVEIFSDPTLASSLVFRGGTALHKMFLTPPARYSEDIDLVQAAPGPIG